MHKTKKNKTKRRVFNKKHYNANDGFLTTTWGPPLWHYLHTMSFNYPVNPSMQDKKHYRDFILQLEHVLPCKYCRQNLKKNFIQLPLTISNMKNRETFSRYIYDLHELINNMLNKKSGLTYEDVRERYENFRARCTQDTPDPALFKSQTNPTTQIKKTKFTRKNKGKEKEMGCTESLYGKKSKCIIKIVPQEEKGKTFQIDEKCIKKSI
jgi:hypothetical protein